MQGRGATFEESLGNVVKVSLARWGRAVRRWQFNAWRDGDHCCLCMHVFHGAAKLLLALLFIRQKIWPPSVLPLLG